MALIKKLMDVAWDMWDHRNSVLHNDETNFQRRMQHEEANTIINREFNQGKMELLRADKWLLTSRRETLDRDLMDKQRWVTLITGARAAWQHKQEQQPSYENERRAMEAYLTTPE